MRVTIPEQLDRGLRAFARKTGQGSHHDERRAGIGVQRRPINLGSKRYVWVDGFIISPRSRQTRATAAMATAWSRYGSATHCRATRLIVKRRLRPVWRRLFVWGRQRLRDCHHFRRLSLRLGPGRHGRRLVSGRVNRAAPIRLTYRSARLRTPRRRSTSTARTPAATTCARTCCSPTTTRSTRHLPQKGGQNRKT